MGSFLWKRVLEFSQKIAPNIKIFTYFYFFIMI